MTLRLPHVLVLMFLVLAAGVVSVKVLETQIGGATVPGIVLIDAPFLSGGDVDDLIRRWPGAVEELIPAGEGALAPFEPAIVGRMAARGDATALFCLDEAVSRQAQRAGAGDQPVWKAVLGEDVPAALDADRARLIVDWAAEYLRAQQQVQGFLLGVVFHTRLDPPLEPVVASLVQAADALPSFRRTSIVVLGDRLAGTREPVRRSVRIDRGEWRRRARPKLADLLEPGW